MAPIGKRHSRPRARAQRSSQRRYGLPSRVRRITDILERTYGTPDLGNKQDPLDELIYIILSQMTTGKSFARVFDRLKSSVPNWGQLASLPMRQLKSIIKDAGLSNQKAPRLKALVRRVSKDFGTTDLAAISSMPDADAEKYLTSLPGVGIKSAKCVLMYSLGRDVLPVDTHVARVARRLGLLDTVRRGSDVHRRLELTFPPGTRYAFHVNAIAHGRKVCLAIRPRCRECPLVRLCPSRVA